jgi:hypothetical protein
MFVLLKESHVQAMASYYLAALSLYSFFFVTKKLQINIPPFSGKLLGCYIGKCSGSIRSIVRHPELPLIASCGEFTSIEAPVSFCWGTLWFPWHSG